jgi:phage gp29-like protein
MHPARNGYVARQALSRVLMLPYLYKNYSTRDFAEFLEIYGLPLRLGKYPTGASDEEKRRLLAAVVGIGHNAAGIIPMGTEIDFQNAAAGTDVPFATMLERMDGIESKIIVGQTLTSGEGQHGTQALGTVHNEVRMDILAADAELISDTLTAQLVAPMVLLNIAGADPRRLPRFEFDTGQPEDLALYAAHLPTLANAGLRIPLRWVHEKLRIPQPEPGGGRAQRHGRGATRPRRQA